MCLLAGAWLPSLLGVARLRLLTMEGFHGQPYTGCTECQLPDCTHQRQSCPSLGSSSYIAFGRTA